MILQLSTPYTSPIPQTSHPLNHRPWCHLTNKLKPYCEQANCQNIHIWNSHLQHPAGLFQTMPYTQLLFSSGWFYHATAYVQSALYAITPPSVRLFVCLSVRLSVRWVNQSKTIEVNVMQLSAQSSL